MSVLDRALAARARAAVVATRMPLQWWARSYRGIRPRFAVMASPPTVTVGGSASVVRPGNSGFTTAAPWTGGAITLAGSVNYTSDGATPPKANPRVTTLDDDTIVGGTASQRLRFITDAPVFEVPIIGYAGIVNAIVDGEFVSRARGLAILPSHGLVHQVRFDFGANVASFALASIAKLSGGSGHAVGDVLTLAGGTGAPARVIVNQVSGGIIASVTVCDGGIYSVVPTGTIGQAASTGAGIGATFNAPIWAQANSSRRQRRVEILFPGGSWNLPVLIAGVNVGAQDSISPWPVSARVPRLLVVGDSQQSTYLDYGGGGMASSIAQRLGLWDGFVCSSVGGTGYLTADGGFVHGLPWTDSRRIADFVAQKPDIVLIIGGQNDAGQSLPALTAAITAMLNDLQTRLPQALFVGIGPVSGNGSALTAAIAAGWAAVRDPSRARFIDNVTVPWISGNGHVTAPAGNGNADFYISSDAAHLTQAGSDLWADIAAPRIAASLLDMIG